MSPTKTDQMVDGASIAAAPLVELAPAAAVTPTTLAAALRGEAAKQDTEPKVREALAEENRRLKLQVEELLSAKRRRRKVDTATSSPGKVEGAPSSPMAGEAYLLQQAEPEARLPSQASPADAKDFVGFADV